MEYGFDTIAKNYSKNIKELPHKYVNLISSVFDIYSDSKVLDIGCGTGLLTFPLLKYSKNISGLDISSNMIDIAKEEDRENQINWINADVSTYKFPKEYYDLVITYESMHLFPNIPETIENIYYSLKNGGYICMGWCYYNWELVLKQEVVDIFYKYGVDWGEWSYQQLNSFNDIIKSMKYLSLTPPIEKYICIKEEWSVKEIVEYITSISKVLTLNIESIKKIKIELAEQLVTKYGNTFYGDTRYCIRYSRKLI